MVGYGKACLNLAEAIYEMYFLSRDSIKGNEMGSVLYLQNLESPFLSILTKPKDFSAKAYLIPS